MSSRLLVLDTSVAVLLIAPTAPKGEELQWKAARALATIANGPDWKLAIAAPAMGEVLAGFAPERQRDAAELLEQLFSILVLDARAAELVGRVARTSITGRSGSVSRQSVKVDVEIVACAIRWSAGGLCFLDGDHAKIADRAKRNSYIQRDFSVGLDVGPPERFLPSQVGLPLGRS